MSLAMPSPLLIGNTYYLRVRIPSDLIQAANGRVINIPVGDSVRRVTIKAFVKVSLDTREAREAKQRFAVAYSAIQTFLSALKEGPKPLTQKQSLAIAGEIRAAFIEAFDDDPGEPEVWASVESMNKAALSGQLNPLTIPTLGQQATDLERRFGQLADVVLAKKGVVVDSKYRPRLLQQVAEGLNDMARVNKAKAEGDYSDSGSTNRYPVFEASPSTPAANPSDALTFESVIDKEATRRSLGKDAVPLRGQTEKKFRTAADEFAKFRKSEDITTVTAEEADAWVIDMLAKGELTNNTIKQRLQNVKTVVEWARKQSLGKRMFPTGNPLELVQPPNYQTVASNERTYTLLEAKQVLTAARKEKRPELRWLPWMCAYSGARINEVAQLTKADFFKIGDDWFYRLTTAGGKTLKTRSSERRVPVHPALVDEGLIDFINGTGGKDTTRLFPARSQPNISEWLRGDLKITRENLAPNHGWRHLFEDLCIVAGMLDAARNYITGRATGKSGEGYGKSDVMLPGLASEMRKVLPISLL